MSVHLRLGERNITDTGLWEMENEPMITHSRPHLLLALAKATIALV